MQLLATTLVFVGALVSSIGFFANLDVIDERRNPSTTKAYVIITALLWGIFYFLTHYR